MKQPLKALHLCFYACVCLYEDNERLFAFTFVLHYESGAMGEGWFQSPITPLKEQDMYLRNCVVKVFNVFLQSL